MILTGQPTVFTAGTATILGELRADSVCLRIELAQIESGGEGVLLGLGALARRFAQLHGLSRIEWVVHALHCAKPNLKLRRVLERRGFLVREIDGVEAYYLSEQAHVKRR